jgi:hypothetical protein
MKPDRLARWRLRKARARNHLISVRSQGLVTSALTRGSARYR